MPAFGPSVQRARASPSESERALSAAARPPSSATQATGTSASARPVESETRIAIVSVTSCPAAPLACSVRTVSRVLAPTGSASARIASALSMRSTVANSVCRPGKSPSVHTVRTLPSASVIAEDGSRLPCPSVSRNFTSTPSTGRARRLVTRTTTACGRRPPANAR